MRGTSAVLLALLLTLPHGAAAQQHAMDRGAWTLAGTAGLSHSRGSSGAYLFFAPAVGYFVAPGLEISADLSLSHSWGNGSSATWYGAGPGVTYYFRKGATKLHPFMSASAFYIHKSDYAGGTAHGFSWRGSAGVALLVARNVALLGEGYFNHATSHSGSGINRYSNTQVSYGTSFGVAVFLF